MHQKIESVRHCVRCVLFFKKEIEEEAKRLRRRKHCRRATSQLEHLRPAQNESTQTLPTEQSDHRVSAVSRGQSRADGTVNADVNNTASILPAINGQSLAAGAKNDKDGRRSRLVINTQMLFALLLRKFLCNIVVLFSLLCNNHVALS